MEAKLLVTMLGKQQSSMSGWRSVLSSAARIRVGVSDLVARGTLRISLKPLLDELPVAGGVKVRPPPALLAPPVPPVLPVPPALFARVVHCATIHVLLLLCDAAIPCRLFTLC